MTEAVRQPLTRRKILAAAMQLVDREGLAALSMRRLGRELGVEAMSLYNHIPNKDALLDGLAVAALAEQKLPPDEGGDWAERLRALSRALRRVAHAHPHIFPLIVMRPPTTPASLRPFEAVLAALHRAGFDGETALTAFRTLAAYVAGYALGEITGAFSETNVSGESPGLDIRRLPQEEFPQIVALATYLPAADGDRRFELGLDTILAGLRIQLARRAR